MKPAYLDQFNPPCQILSGGQLYDVEVIDHEVVFTNTYSKSETIFSRVWQNGKPNGLWRVRGQDFKGEEVSPYLSDVHAFGLHVHAVFGDDFTVLREL
jgi:hypothetical protein